MVNTSDAYLPVVHGSCATAEKVVANIKIESNLVFIALRIKGIGCLCMKSHSEEEQLNCI